MKTSLIKGSFFRFTLNFLRFAGQTPNNYEENVYIFKAKFLKLIFFPQKATLNTGMVSTQTRENGYGI